MDDSTTTSAERPMRSFQDVIGSSYLLSIENYSTFMYRPGDPRLYVDLSGHASYKPSEIVISLYVTFPEPSWKKRISVDDAYHDLAILSVYIFDQKQQENDGKEAWHYLPGPCTQPKPVIGMNLKNTIIYHNRQLQCLNNLFTILHNVEQAQPSSFVARVDTS